MLSLQKSKYRSYKSSQGVHVRTQAVGSVFVQPGEEKNTMGVLVVVSAA